MKSLPILLAASLLSAPLAVFAQNQPQAVVVAEKSADGGAVAGEIQLQGKIKSIDTQARSVVVEGANGNTMKLNLGEKAKNFNQIKVGDLVTLTVQRALAMELQKVGNDGIRERIESDKVVTAKPGEKPGVAVERTVLVVANVVAIDAKQKVVTLRGPEHTVELAIKDPATLKKIKVGDQVEAIYIEAVALTVSADPAANKK